MPASLRRLPLPCSLVFLSLAAARAQCTNPWLAMQSLGGANGRVHATALWDRDGAGPQPPVAVVAGDFTLAGGPAAHVATFDPATATWAPLGTGTNGPVRAVAVLANGELVVGGAFSTAGGGAAARIARWNGTAWSALGAGVDGTVLSLHVRANGDLLAGGAFTSAGGVSAPGLARWDGSAWSPVGSGLGGEVWALASRANGDLLAGGSGLVVSGTPVWVARWDGVSWAPFGANPTPIAGLAVAALLPLANGEVVVGGNYLNHLTGSPTYANVARTSGGAWSGMGSLPGQLVYSLAALADGRIVAGNAAVVGINHPTIGIWDGNGWSPLGTGVPGTVHTVLALPGGDVLAGGSFVTTGANSLANVARWNGATWAPVGGSGSPTSPPNEVGTAANGDLVGAWTEPVGTAAAYTLARWNPTGWTNLGTSNHQVNAFGALPNGDLAVGGFFTSIGGVAANRVARWNGTAWSPLGSGIAGDASRVSCFATLPNGDLVAGGNFQFAGGVPARGIARFNGSAWSAFGVGLMGQVRALLVLPGGTLLAAGTFPQDGAMNPLGAIATWNGTSWTSLGGGVVGYVDAVALRPNGDLIVGGNFTQAGGTPAIDLARWNGTWSAIGDVTGTAVHEVLALPNGDVLVAGNFTAVGGVAANHVARWNGVSWAPVATGTDGAVYDVAALANGDIAMSGAFTHAGPVYSPGLVRLSTTCPASVTTVAPACAGTGGPNTLTARSLPWIGSTFRSRATGLAPQSLALQVVGFTPASVPLSTILPQGGPGCLLLASPDLLDVLVPSQGAVELSLTLPTSPALAGAVLHQQVVAIELDPAFAITALTSSNGLRLVKGFF